MKDSEEEEEEDAAKQGTGSNPVEEAVLHTRRREAFLLHHPFLFLRVRAPFLPSISGWRHPPPLPNSQRRRRQKPSPPTSCLRLSIPRFALLKTSGIFLPLGRRRKGGGERKGSGSWKDCQIGAWLGHGGGIGADPPPRMMAGWEKGGGGGISFCAFLT